MTSCPHLFIATPCFGGLLTQTYLQSLIACMAEAPSHNLRLTLSTLGSDALITRARNTLLHQFLTQTDATHLLFIDSDIGFSLPDILALLNADKPVIGAAYPLKSHYWDSQTTKFLTAGEPAQTASLRYVGDCNALYSSPQCPEIAEVSYVGTGFMLITRATITTLINTCPETRYTHVDARQTHLTQTPDTPKSDAYALFDSLIDPVTQTYLSEDFAFCHRWARAGGSIWLHRGISLSHTGPATFQGNPMQRTLPSNI